MNAVEIEQAMSKLAKKPFDRQEYPFQFLGGFGDKETALKRLRTGESNKSDFCGVLLSNSAMGQVSALLAVTECLEVGKYQPEIGLQVPLE